MTTTTTTISTDLARRLRAAGVRWRPASGDRFLVDAPELAGEVFTLSEMTIEARRYATGTVLAFNGTTEWALDSVMIERTLWLPREDQLRELLGGTFRSLRREDLYVVTTVVPEGSRDVEVEHRAPEPADAYALAVLDLVGRAAG